YQGNYAKGVAILAAGAAGGGPQRIAPTIWEALKVGAPPVARGAAGAVGAAYTPPGTETEAPAPEQPAGPAPSTTTSTTLPPPSPAPAARPAPGGRVGYPSPAFLETGEASTAPRPSGAAAGLPRGADVPIYRNPAGFVFHHSGGSTLDELVTT